MLPDFLCIGAQKAGTSWLFVQLQQHPQVWMPPVKELHYFDHLYVPENRKWTKWHIVGGASRALKWHMNNVEHPDFEYVRYLTDLASKDIFSEAWYERAFDRPAAKDKLCGDITPEYSTIPEEGVDYVQPWRCAVSTARRAGISCLAVYRGLARDSWVFDPAGFGLRSGLLSPKRWRRQLSQSERELADYLRGRLFPRSALRQLRDLLHGRPKTRGALQGLVHYLRFSAYSFVRSESGTLGASGALLFTEIRGLTAEPVVLETPIQVPQSCDFRRPNVLPHKMAGVSPCHDKLHQKLIWRTAYLWVYFRSTPRNRRLLREDPARLRFRLPNVMKRILGFEGQGLY